MKNDNDLLLPCSEDKPDWVSVNLPWLKGKLSGGHLMPALAILCIAAPVSAGLYYHHKEQEKWIIQRNEITGQNAKNIEKIGQAINRYDRTQEAVIYILSLPPAEREKLNLAKPDRIRELERGR